MSEFLDGARAWLTGGPQPSSRLGVLGAWAALIVATFIVLVVLFGCVQLASGGSP